VTIRLAAAATIAYIVTAGIHNHTSAQEPGSIAEAVSAFQRYDLAESRRIYERIIGGDGAVHDRVAAHRALAVYDWRFGENPATAERHLLQALALTDQPAPLHRLLAEIALDRELNHDAREHALHALSASRGAADSVEAMLLFADAAAAETLRTTRGPAGSPDRTALLRARQYVDEVLRRQPGRQEAAATLVALALLLNDGPALLRGWKSYYLVADDAPVNPVLAEAHRTLADLAEVWRGRTPDDHEREALVRALAQSRFYRYAASVAEAIEAPSQFARDVIAYQRFIDGIADVNQRFYPRVANGLRDYETAYDSAVLEQAQALWRTIRHDSRNARFERDAFFELIRERFGAEGYLGRTVNFYGMVLGHVVHDERRMVEQYGYSDEFRYISIDHMVSRDFTSWYGTTNVGGWGTASTMFQIRSAYLSEPFRRLAWVTDSTQRAQLLERLEELHERDLGECSADPYCDPASVPLRIKLSASDSLFARLQRTGLRDEQLALAFVAETIRLNIESAVFAHEGRHALDQRYFSAEFSRMPHEERELRAKLSEVVFSSSPRLALTGSILGSQLDETSGHGAANRHFRVLLVDWMRANRARLPQLDPDLPLMLQVDRLTDQDIVCVALGADPLARRRVGGDF
jgi:hypothetical protein